MSTRRLYYILTDSVCCRYPQRAESTPTASQSEDTLSSMYSDEEDEEEIVASSDDDEQESPEDYCKGMSLCCTPQSISHVVIIDRVNILSKWSMTALYYIFVSDLDIEH